MEVLHYICLFFGGVFGMNAVPHLAAGVQGRAFQTPFAKPPGEGLSSSLVNVFWGFANLVLAYILLVCLASASISSIADVIAAGLGGLAISVFAARHFGKFHGGNAPVSQ